LDQRLDRVPIGVVGKTEIIFDAIQHELLALRGIHIAESTTAAAATKSASTAAATTAILSGNVADAQKESSDSTAHRKHFMYFHEFILLLFVSLKPGHHRVPDAAIAHDAIHIPITKTALFLGK
jgi:hypothetical protein